MRVELFNIAEDPSEKNNLAGLNPDKVAAMKMQLKAAVAADRDAVALVDKGV